MKHFILKIAWCRVIPVIALVVAFISCNDNDKPKAVHNPNSPVVLTSFEPDSGRMRDYVLLNGENFGSDPSMIKVLFNSSEAKVINSTGTRILALVPRLPGDTCILSVQIGNQKKDYLQDFRYKVTASVTTLAGNGTATSSPTWQQGLDNTILTPVYIGIDMEDNVLVTTSGDYLFRINAKENTISLVATGAQDGFNHRCMPYVNPRTHVIQFGAEDARDKFMFLDPKEGYAPKTKYIKSWEWNKLPQPASGNPSRHYQCLLNEDDNHFYTRYDNGIIAKICPDTWHAEAIGMTPSGSTLGLAFNPVKKNELWMGYYESGTNGMNNAIARVDVSDTTKLSSGQLTTYERMSSQISAAGHRDGPLHLAQFNQIRGISFDSDGNLYVGDCGNHCIRMINTKTMMVETIIGIPGKYLPFQNGNRDMATFYQPHGIVVDSDGVIYVSDYSNHRVRRIAIE